MEVEDYLTISLSCWILWVVVIILNNNSYQAVDIHINIYRVPQINQ